MRRVGLIVGMVVAATLALLPSMAAAACCAAGTADPEDVAGRLDLSYLSWQKDGVDAAMTVTVRTHDAWRPRVLARGSGNRLVVAIDTDDDRAIDYTARIRRVGGSLWVFIAGSGAQFEPLPARKPNGRTVRFTIPADSPPNPARAVRMFARSRFVNDGRCADVCADRAPDHGRIRLVGCCPPA